MPLRGMPFERAYARTANVNPHLQPPPEPGIPSVRSLLVLYRLRPGLQLLDLL